MTKKWKKTEETYLKRYASKQTLAELGERFGAEPDEVTAKLDELGLFARDSDSKAKLEHDPVVKVYERGLTALDRGKWQAAIKEFEQVLEETDRTELGARARQYLRLAQQQLQGPDDQEDTDPFLLAVYDFNRGELDKALDLCVRGGRQGKDERFAYLAASIHARRADAEQAAKLLSTAIELNPSNRIHAHFDRDFDPVRDHEEVARLFVTGG